MTSVTNQTTRRMDAPSVPGSLGNSDGRGVHPTLQRVALLLALLASSVTAADVPRPTQVWKETKTLAAPEAHQAAAANAESVFAIGSTSIAKYNRATGERLATSTGDAKHLNSGYFFEGNLYCAHSNYPATPERSEIKLLDPATMRLTTHKDFGDFGGSLTWCVRQDDAWWCNFAKYGDENSRTFLARFDDQWRETGRWTYPAEVVKRLGRYSLSGGVWRGRLLLVTGHDDRVIFRLRLPTASTVASTGGTSPRVLEFVDEQAAPFTGQGIAYDPVTHGLIGIDRARKQLVFASLEAPAPQPRLPRDKLLVRRADHGEPLPVKSLDDWQLRRDEIQRNMQIVMGPLPGVEKRGDLELRIEEEVDCDKYLRCLITYASEPGSRVPAYLCIPKSVLEIAAAPNTPAAKRFQLKAGQSPVPAVLCLHGTDNVVGHGTVVGLGNRPNRQYATELAELGFVTLAPNYPILAKYQPDVHGLGWESGTMKAIWDNIRGLDLLETFSFVKRDGTTRAPQRRGASFGAIGHSLGGHNSVYTAAFDDRLVAVVSSCGLDSYLDYYGGEEKSWFPEKGWTQTRYMPRMRDYRGRLADIPFDFHEILGVLAPRDVLIVAPLRDSNFRHDSVDRVAAAAREVFALHGVPNRLRVEHPDCDHDFPVEMRQLAYKLFAESLR